MDFITISIQFLSGYVLGLVAVGFIRTVAKGKPQKTQVEIDTETFEFFSDEEFAEFLTIEADDKVTPIIEEIEEKIRYSPKTIAAVQSYVVKIPTLQELKEEAKALGIKGYHLYKDPVKLQLRIDLAKGV